MRDAVFQAADTIQGMTAAAYLAAARGVYRDPVFGGLSGNKLKVRGEDADDDVGIAIENDGLSVSRLSVARESDRSAWRRTATLPPAQRDETLTSRDDCATAPKMRAIRPRVRLTSGQP